MAQSGGAHYLGAMPLPRPASPRTAWNDLRAFVAQRQRHQWISAVLALIIPSAILWVFVLDSSTNLEPGPQAIYVESWSTARSDEEIKARQKVDSEQRAAMQKERQRQWKELGDRLGM